MTDHEYAPGWTPDVLAMLRRRTAADRAAFVLPVLADGMRVLDVGCGPGTISKGLVSAVGPTGRVLGVDLRHDQLLLARRHSDRLGLVQGSVDELPVGDRRVDVVFAHALVEHLPRPAAALGELRRVLRSGGLLALASSDWRGAVLRPRTSDVDEALRGHYLLRRRAGGDPFAGGALLELVRAAGCTEIAVTERQRVDLGYRELAHYVGTRLTAAAATAPADERAELAGAARAAQRWAQRDGEFTQRWVEVIARVP